MNSKSGVEGAAVLAFGSYAQVEAQAIEKAKRDNVDVPIYRTKSGRFTLVKPSDDGVRKFEPHNTIAAPVTPPAVQAPQDEPLTDQEWKEQMFTAWQANDQKEIQNLLDMLPPAVVR